MKKIYKKILSCLVFCGLIVSLLYYNCGEVLASVDTIGRNGKNISHDDRFDGMTIRSGIDVSHWQGNIDWNLVKNDGIEFAFIKVAGRDAKDGTLYLDSKAYQNIEGAIAAGIKVGVYFFSQAINELEAEEEADYICNAIAGYEVSLPVVMDYEYATYNENGVNVDGRLATSNTNKEEKTRITESFCKRIINNGYTPCLYANKYFLENNVDGKLIGEKYRVWIARYTSNGDTNYNCNATDYFGKYCFWQYAVCNSGTVNGIDTSVDIDYWYDDGSLGNVPLSVNYSVHVQNSGWQNWLSNGNISGTCGKSLQLEALKLKVDGNANLGIVFKTHIQDIGWSDNCFDGEISGTTGKSLRLEAVCIALTGKDSNKYDIYYRVHAQNIGWMGWTKNGQAAGTTGLSASLEAIQVVLVKKDSLISNNMAGISQNTVQSFISKDSRDVSIETTPSVIYSSHVQYQGWQGYASNGEASGTTEQGLRLEGVRIDMRNQPCSGTIIYRTHVQNIGWQAPVCENAISGTTGESLRLEAIEICLGGKMADDFDIYYRAHVQNIGWMGWTKNGETAGTTGLAFRLEAIQIVILPKNSSEPTYDYKSVKSVTAKPYITQI